MEEKIPEGVIDKEAYKEYKKLEVHPILNGKKEVELSDGTSVSLTLFPHLLQKRIEHLSIAEQNSVLNKKKIYFQINNKYTAQKKKAWGNLINRQVTMTSNGILAERQGEILELFGRMFTIEEVFKIINKDWGIFCSKGTVQKFRIDNAEEISKAIEKFKQSYAEIRLGVKRSRIEELVWMYGRKKDDYTNKNNKDDYKLMLTTLEQIRKEAEGDRLTIDGRIDVNYEANIQAHLREEIYRTLNIKEIILGRVAARMNISPAKLIYSLNNSFYAKFSNVLGNFDESQANSKELIYPSQMNYDFERIKKEFHKRDAEIAEAVILDEKIEPKDESKANMIKNALLEKLKQKKESVDNMRADVAAKSDTTEKEKKKDSSVRGPKRKG